MVLVLMVIISPNVYFKIGFQSLFLMYIKATPSVYDGVVIYDRGDGLISLMPVESAMYLTKGQGSLYHFLLCTFITFDYKREPVTELKYYMDKVVRERSKYASNLMLTGRRKLTSKELQLLNMYMSGRTINSISKSLGGLCLKTIYTRKYKILEKLGVSSLIHILKLQNYWQQSFNK